MGYELRHGEWVGVLPAELVEQVAENVERVLRRARELRCVEVGEAARAYGVSVGLVYDLVKEGVVYGVRRAVARGNGQRYQVVYVDPRDLRAYLALDYRTRRAVRRGEVGLEEASGWVLCPREGDPGLEKYTRATYGDDGDWLPEGRLLVRTRRSKDEYWGALYPG